MTCGDRFSYDDMLARVWRWRQWCAGVGASGLICQAAAHAQVNNEQPGGLEGVGGSKATLSGGRGRAAGKDEGPVEVVGGSVMWNECVVPLLQRDDRQQKPVQDGRARKAAALTNCFLQPGMPPRL